MKFLAVTLHSFKHNSSGLDFLQNRFLINIGKIKLWARLLLCLLFVFGGANFSHGDQLHHQISGSASDHHLKIDDKNIVVNIEPHYHFEQADRNVQLNDLSVHCGAPELQPDAMSMCYSFALIEKIDPLPDLLIAGWTSEMEPPPPRS